MPPEPVKHASESHQPASKTADKPDDRAPRSQALLRTAAGLLPDLPVAVHALSDTGGEMRIELLSENGRVFTARAPRLRTQPRMRLRVRVNPSSDLRFDIDLVVTSIEREDEWTGRVTLEVTDVWQREGRRAHERLRVDEHTPLHVVTCRSLETGSTVEVDLADLSESGVAFFTGSQFHVGDVIALMPMVGGQRIRLRARVLHTGEAEGDLSRVGCEVIAIRPEDKRRLAAVARENAERDQAA